MVQSVPARRDVLAGGGLNFQTGHPRRRVGALFLVGLAGVLLVEVLIVFVELFPGVRVGARRRLARLTLAFRLRQWAIRVGALGKPPALSGLPPDDLASVEREP